MVTGRKNLPKIIPHSFPIINITYSQCSKTYDRIHWCPDIVRHIGKESTLCLVCCLRSTHRLRKCLIHIPVRGTVRHNQNIFLLPVHLTAHCHNMKPTSFSCFLMNIFKIPFLLFRSLDSLQIIFLRILRIPWMQFSQNINILPDLFYRKSHQFFHIRADIICLICFGVQHQENIIHIH